MVDKSPYETMRNNWLNARLLPPEGHPKRRKDDGHHFNLVMFDDIYKLGVDDAFQQENQDLRDAVGKALHALEGLFDARDKVVAAHHILYMALTAVAPDKEKSVKG